MCGDRGHLHVIQGGLVEVRHEPHRALHIVEPTVLLYPRPLPHRFRVEDQYIADFNCATVAFNAGRNNPVVQALPPVLALTLSELPEMQGTLDLLFAHLGEEGGGRQSLVDRLFEVLLIQILRKVISDGLVPSGMLAGLAHPQVGKALIAMHETISRRWTLHELAAIAGMSRSNFAAAFKATLGLTMVEYLNGGRVSAAQALLRNGMSLKRTAVDVGFSSPVAMARVFREHLGESSRAWLRSDKGAKRDAEKAIWPAHDRAPVPKERDVAALVEITLPDADLRIANEHLLIATIVADERRISAESGYRRLIDEYAAAIDELCGSLGRMRAATTVIAHAPPEELSLIQANLEHQVAQMSQLVGDLVGGSRGNPGAV